MFLKASSHSQIDAGWLADHLQDDQPRLIWQYGDKNLIKKRIKADPAARAYYDFLIKQADGILEEPVLERILTGRRLLGVSRKALKRSSYLAFAWRMTGKEKYMERLEALLESVSTFSDWNPSHFLDTAEMSAAVAISLDWAGGDMDKNVRKMARQALYEKGLVAGMHERVQGVFSNENNWNQVCNAGMVAAALTLAGEYPEESLHAINRMLEGIQHVLEAYAPDGVYPEGATYWIYGTQFNLLLISMLETALGSNFAIPDAPGFMESADFMHLMTAPKGKFYNFYDCGESSSFIEPLLWFAMKTGSPRHAQADAIRELPKRDISTADSSYRIAPIAFLWYVHYSSAEGNPLPLAWSGAGMNPIGVFRSAHNDPEALYLAFKGGRAANNHGNMDAGSFILEMDGIRWAVDMGNQSYHPLEEYYKVHGGSLWDRTQDSARWELLTKNNFGHSTLTIDNDLHLNTGMARITEFDAQARTATIDMGGPLAGQVLTAERTFSVPGDRVVEITDRLSFLEAKDSIRWQMTTQAEVTTMPGGAILHQDGKTLRLEVLEPEGTQVTVTSLNPPPHEMDRVMPGLKRIDVTVPGYIGNTKFQIRVRLSRE